MTVIFEVIPSEAGLYRNRNTNHKILPETNNFLSNLSFNENKIKTVHMRK